jgi:hypothetical protein
MHIKDRDEGTRIQGGMPGLGEVRSAKGSAHDEFNNFEYRDTPAAQKRFMKELESKMKAGIPPLNKAGNK